MSDTGPFPIEDFLASLVEALKIRGDARAITAVIEGDCRFAHSETDFGIDYWNLLIALPVHIFYALSDEERRITAEVIEEVGSPFFVSTPQDALRRVVITPKVVPATENWRADPMGFDSDRTVSRQSSSRDRELAG
jgi:hypothetical protein